jgi:hypothetical protein
MCPVQSKQRRTEHSSECALHNLKLLASASEHALDLDQPLLRLDVTQIFDDRKYAIFDDWSRVAGKIETIGGGGVVGAVAAAK